VLQRLRIPEGGGGRSGRTAVRTRLQGLRGGVRAGRRLSFPPGLSAYDPDHSPGEPAADRRGRSMAMPMSHKAFPFDWPASQPDELPGLLTRTLETGDPSRGLAY